MAANMNKSMGPEYAKTGNPPCEKERWRIEELEAEIANLQKALDTALSLKASNEKIYWTLLENRQENVRHLGDTVKRLQSERDTLNAIITRQRQEIGAVRASEVK